MEPKVYFVTLLDINWPGFGPLNAPLNYSANAPSPTDSVESEKRLDIALEILGESIESRFVIAVHSGTYCRSLFYREPFMAYWHKAVAQGAEIALHPHEEVVGLGTLYWVKRHMRQVITNKRDDLLQQQIRPVGVHTANFAYADFMTALLEELGIDVDLSCAPGIEDMLWGAAWKGAPFSAFYLCSVDPTHFNCDHPRSKVLEIPVGCDGGGTSVEQNYLLNEQTESLENLQRVWDAVVQRSQREGMHQFIQFKCHLTAMDNDELRARLERFLEYALANSGVAVTPTQAKKFYDGLAIG